MKYQLKLINKNTHIVVPKNLLVDGVENGVFRISTQKLLSKLTGISIKKFVGRPRKRK